jgi:DNA-binding transcriptional LysR family regulator
MLDGIDALVALETFGTVTEAATRLRITQSAVTKRIQSLQATVGFRLVEPDGRRLRLTSRAVDFLDRARPLVAELRGLLKPAALDSPSSISLALADSIASSWGPAVVRRVTRELPRIKVDLHVHRSVLVIESVRLGRYDAGLCTFTPGAKDLIDHAVVDEPVVLVLSGFAAKLEPKLPTVAIEPTSATWRAIQPLLASHHPELLAGEWIFVESFAAVVQMVRAGFGNGLVPLGLARDMGIGKRALRALPNVARRVALLTRKSMHREPAFVALRDRLTAATREHFATRRAPHLRPA